MSFRITISGLPGAGPIEVTDYSVSESSTPLAAGDSSGGVGTFTVPLPAPDPSMNSSRRTPWWYIRNFGPQYLAGREIYISDARKGFTLGTITGASESYDGAMVTLSGVSRLSRLNVYQIQAHPFSGTLRNAFLYYLSLAGITTDVFVDDVIASTPVVFPGWNGELWFALKQMATAVGCDISLVSGIILLRPVRTRVASNNRDLTRSTSAAGNTLAQTVEVYRYNNRAITNELVYPPGGWNPEVEVLNVNAGETAEYTLELSSSLSSFQAPVMQEFVSQTHNTSSVYTVVADDGLPVTPSAWTSAGGRVEIALGADTKTLEVRLTGPTNLPTKSGTPAQNFSLALGSDTTGNRYSTLRILGTGVAFDKRKVVFRTGATAQQTATEVGLTIDNPFLSSTNEVYNAGTRAARQYAGAVMTLTGSVSSINRRGDSGQASAPTYADVRSRLISAIGGSPTYAQVKTYTNGQGASTYFQDRQMWLAAFRNDDIDQVFGNVAGARVFDRKSRRFYRVRDASLAPAGITLQSADSDITHEDHREFYSGQTYAQQRVPFQGLTYNEVEMMGLYRG